jgi:hypothetical protein
MGWGVWRLNIEIRFSPQDYIVMVSPTLVRDTVTARIQVPGRRGRGAFREVSTTSNKL